MSHVTDVCMLLVLTVFFVDPANQPISATGAHSMLHVLAVAVLPLLTLFAGVLSLYVNPEKQPKARWIFLLILFVTGGATIYGAVSDDKERSDTIAKQIDQLATIKEISNTTNSISETTHSILDYIKGRGIDIGSLQTRGLDVGTVIRTSDSADKALAAVKPAVLQEASSSNVTVVYYPKDVDGPVVVNALKEGGFQVDTHLGNPGNAALQTNAIWVGDNVKVDQAKFVALTLVRAGVKITSIRRFRQGDGAKSNRIEVGTDKQLLNAPALTVDAISTLKEIPPRDQSGGGLVI